MTNLSLTSPYVEPLESAKSRKDVAPHKAPRPEAGAAKGAARPAAAREERLANAAFARRNDELTTEQIRLQDEIQALKAYINGRYAAWFDLHAEIVKYRDALAGMDRMVQARDASIARQDAEKRQLELKLQSFERRASEPVKGRNAREEASAELQRKLAAQLKQIERLEADHATLARALEEAKKAAADGGHRNAALDEELKRRDESMAELRAELAQARDQLEQARRIIGDLSTAKDELAKRVEALEKEISVRSERSQADRDDLRRVHEQLELVQQQLADRAEQLAAREETLDQKSRHAKELETQLQTARRDAEQARGDLEKLAAHAEELGRLHAEARTEIEQLEQQRAARELDTKLGDELREAHEQLRSAQQQLAEQTAELTAGREAVEQKARHAEELETQLHGARRDAEQARGDLEKLAAHAEELGRLHAEARTEIERLAQQGAAREVDAKLEDDLRAADGQLRSAQAQLAERTAQLTASQEAMEQKSRDAEELEAQLRAARRETEQAHGDLEKLVEHAESLGRLHGEARSQIERLEQELAAHENAVKLEPELRIEKAMVTLLERGVGKLADIGVRPAKREDVKRAAVPDTATHEQREAAPPNGQHDAAVTTADGAAAVEAARKLVALSAREPAEYPLTKNRMTVGRGRGSDIRIEDHFVSRLHAMIDTTPHGTIIEDAASRNGIFVNSQRVTRCVLHDGDVVCLGGELKFRFVDATH